MTDAGDDVVGLFDRLPEGWSTVRFRGGRWGVTVTGHRGGSRSLEAVELGGDGVLGANLYETDAGPVLRPCEVPAEDVLELLCDHEQADVDDVRTGRRRRD